MLVNLRGVVAGAGAAFHMLVWRHGVPAGTCSHSTKALLARREAQHGARTLPSASASASVGGRSVIQSVIASSGEVVVDNGNDSTGWIRVIKM